MQKKWKISEGGHGKFDWKSRKSTSKESISSTRGGYNFFSGKAQWRRGVSFDLDFLFENFLPYQGTKQHPSLCYHDRLLTWIMFLLPHIQPVIEKKKKI